MSSKGKDAPNESYVPPQIARTTGSYMLLEVPNDAHADDKARSLTTSFLRMGSHAPQLSSQPGYDLASMFPNEEEYFDDRRKRDGGPDFVAQETRISETEDLYSRGGWWDHAGGNRISTTEGDKVEVIRGNYRLAVLGRQLPGEESWEESAGLDFSGGLIRDKQRLPGEIFSYEWVDTWGGTWRVVEETKRGDIDDTYWGNKKTTKYGDEFREETGSEDDNDDEPTPDITSKTWAKSIEANIASISKPVDSSHGETWALNVRENTFTLAKSSLTNALTIQEATNVGNITTSTAYAMKNTVSVGVDKDEIGIAVSAFDIQAIGVKANVTLAGATVGVDIAPAKLNVSMAAQVGITIGDSFDVYMGNKIIVRFGSQTNVLLAPAIIEAEVAAFKLNLFLGIALTIKLIAIEIEPDKKHLSLAENSTLGTYFKIN